MKIKNIIFKNTESALYYMGILVVLIVAAVYLPVDMLVKRTGYVFPKICLFRQLTGLYCPGCGGTRSVIALLHGHIIQSFIYNPFALFSCVVGAIFYISQTLSILTKGRIHGLRFRKSYIITGVILLAGNFIIKNFWLIVMGIRLIE